MATSDGCCCMEREINSAPIAHKHELFTHEKMTAHPRMKFTRRKWSKQGKSLAKYLQTLLLRAHTVVVNYVIRII